MVTTFLVEQYVWSINMPGWSTMYIYMFRFIYAQSVHFLILVCRCDASVFFCCWGGLCMCMLLCLFVSQSFLFDIPILVRQFFSTFSVLNIIITIIIFICVLFSWWRIALTSRILWNAYKIKNKKDSFAKETAIRMNCNLSFFISCELYGATPWAWI